MTHMLIPGSLVQNWDTRVTFQFSLHFVVTACTADDGGGAGGDGGQTEVMVKSVWAQPMRDNVTL